MVDSTLSGASRSLQVTALAVTIGVGLSAVVFAEGLRADVLPLPSTASAGCLRLNGTSGSLSFALYPATKPTLPPDPPRYLRNVACLAFEVPDVVVFNWAGSGKPINLEVTYGPVLHPNWSGACPGQGFDTLYSVIGVSGEGSFNASAQPYPVECFGYTIGWSDPGNSDQSNYWSDWNNASFVSVNMSWAAR
jgi:hypothetical protein